jgi:hypothetical protein
MEYLADLSGRVTFADETHPMPGFMKSPFLNGKYHLDVSFYLAGMTMPARIEHGYNSPILANWRKNADYRWSP